ncbi:MAG: DegT/DnrJ/EryC1/StrS family aminotransferase [Rhodospirillales bacterium]|nr:DegT/DnrJ/EryC1/StrS family aminotransferase [Rhodospirillales bacterium]
MVGEAEAAAAQATVLSGWLTQGRQVAAFEHEFAAFVGARYACAVSNCTAALHLALLAAGVGFGDEVITVSHSFIATANSVLCCNAMPVFVDIDPQTYNIDPQRISAAVTHRTKAILCVHQMGMPCDLSRVLAVARHHGLPVIEDAACAVGSEIRVEAGQWERIGRPHSDVACFSFHPRKVITTGDGGMLTTANPEWDALFRLWRQHGMSVSDAVRHNAGAVIFESYRIPGFNYRMTDIQAAVGRCQLERLPDILQRRRALAQNYKERLANCPDVHAPSEPVWARSNWQSYCVRLDPACPQVEVMQAMLDDGIATRRGIMCTHLEEAYAGQRPTFPLPQSERARDGCILLPLYPEMTDGDQDRVVDALITATRRFKRPRNHVA